MKKNSELFSRMKISEENGKKTEENRTKKEIEINQLKEKLNELDRQLEEVNSQNMMKDNTLNDSIKSKMISDLKIEQEQLLRSISDFQSDFDNKIKNKMNIVNELNDQLKQFIKVKINR